MTIRRLALRVGQIVVSVGLVSYLVITVPMRDVLTALLAASAGWLAISFALVGATNLLAALQMRAILGAQGMKFSVRQIAGINLITKFYGLFLPSYLAGGVIRWHHFSNPEGKRAQALAAMIFSREVEIVTTVGFGVVFYYLANSSLSAHSAIATLAIALAAAVLIVLLSVSRGPHALLQWAFKRVPLPRRLTQRLLKVSNCLVDFGRRGRTYHLQFLALCILRNALGVTSFICFAAALHIAAPPISLGWIRAALDLVLVLPISIAGLGVRDASLVTLLGHQGVLPAAALAFSFVSLARTLLVALFGGVVEGLRVYHGVGPGLVHPRMKPSDG